MQNMEFENHEGQICWIRDTVFCQEGYCGNCFIYQQEKLCPTCKANEQVWLEMFGEKHSCNYQREGVK